MLHIWYVIFSSQFCTLSVRAIIAASFARTTGCELSGLPNALRCEVHLQESAWSTLIVARGARYALHTLINYKPLAPCGAATHHPSLVIEVTATTSINTVSTGASRSAYLSMTKIPPPSSPSVFSTGTLTWSNVMYAVPAVEE